MLSFNRKQLLTVSTVFTLARMTRKNLYKCILTLLQSQCMSLEAHWRQSLSYQGSIKEGIKHFGFTFNKLAVSIPHLKHYKLKTSYYLTKFKNLLWSTIFSSLFFIQRILSFSLKEMYSHFRSMYCLYHLLLYQASLKVSVS